MSRIFGIIFTVVFVLFFTACQNSSLELKDQLAVLEAEEEKRREEKRGLESKSQEKSAQLDLLKENDGDNTYQIAELEWEKHQLEQAINETDAFISGLVRVKELPAKVARGEATKDQIEECTEVFDFNCPPLDPDWWLEEHP